MTAALLDRPAATWEMTEPEREPWSRRRLLGTMLGGAVAMGLGACGDNGDSTAAANPDGTTTTVAERRPTRVIALGQGADADALIALGIAPVAMSKAFNGTGIYPWTEAALGGRKVELLETLETVPLERIAALKPDVIVATTQYDLDRDLAALGRIATVIGPETTADKQVWQQTTRQVGEAVGMATEAGLLVDRAEATVAAARGRHPDADALLLVYFADQARARLEANPLFAQLPAVRRGSYVDLDRDAAIGLAFPSVLAILCRRAHRAAAHKSVGRPMNTGRVLTLANLIYNGGNHYAAELLARAVGEALR